MCVDRGKTIRQIAAEIGVSKQAVYKRISREPLHTSVYASIDKVDGVVYIAYAGEKLIKQAFSGCDRIQTDNQPTTMYAPDTTLYDILRDELTAKNKQLDEMAAELQREREHNRKLSEQLAVLASQSQKLQLAQMQPQLSDGTEPKQKSLFQKLFKRTP